VAPRVAPYLWILIFLMGLVINRFAGPPETPEQIGEEIRG
jgi:hypothetical protein